MDITKCPGGDIKGQCEGAIACLLEYASLAGGDGSLESVSTWLKSVTLGHFAKFWGNEKLQRV